MQCNAMQYNVPPLLFFFLRMDTKDKCERIIQALNGTMLTGAKEPLLIKFADGGSKKRLHKTDVSLRTGTRQDSSITRQVIRRYYVRASTYVCICRYVVPTRL